LLDEIASVAKITMRTDSEKSSGAGEWKGSQISLVKPLTFMNRSGEPLRRFCEKKFSASENWGVKNLLVVHDELDLELGTVRIKVGGGEGGHNGLRSISECFGSKDYARLRIGIGKPPPEWNCQITDWVLGRFQVSEQAVLEQALQRALSGVEQVLDVGMTRAQNWLNQSTV
jgi:PTH1 family peptidyl-tRNA hydrolase